MSNLVPQSDLPVEPKLVPTEDLPTDYESGEQQFKTAAEGAAQGIAGPLATLAETKLLGVKPEDIEGRRKANPGIHALSEGAGLVGGAMIPGLGEYSLGSKVAEGAGAVAKLASNPISQSAIKAASEMALIQASDETSKWLENDPNQSIQSAISNIGLSAALGGTGGAVFSKAGQVLKSLGKDAEQLPEGLKRGLNLDAMKMKEPLFPEGYTPKRSNTPKVESSGLGDRIAKAIKDNASNASAEAISASIGAGLGHMTGLPGAGWVGALVGERALSPMLKSIIPALGKRVMDMDVNPQAFFSAINASEMAMKGQIGVMKAANSVFSDKQLDIKQPDQSDLDKLDAKLKVLHNDPQNAMKVISTDLEHYMPEHAMVLGQTVGQAIQYLNQLRPNTEKQSPLDSKPVPNPIQKATYNQALSIAENPLLVMSKIKTNTITSSDIGHLNSLYPALYDQMKTHLMNSMVDHLSKQGEIPYRDRLSLSLFMGQPLDSSMKPESIMASQPMPQQPMPQQPAPQPGQKPKQQSTSHLENIAKLDATPIQASQAKQVQKT